MKITVEVNGKPVEIELTADQVATVKKHTDKITDRIKTFEDVLEAISNTEKLKYLAKVYVLDTQGAANEQVKLIAEVLNEGWVADPFDAKQYKYYPWFEVKKDRFVFYCCDFWPQHASVGSRLCFKNTELAEYAGKQFIDIYNNLLK